MEVRVFSRAQNKTTPKGRFMLFVRKPNFVPFLLRGWVTIIYLDSILLLNSNERTFRILIAQKTLLFLQVGVAAAPYCYGHSMIAFISRVKTRIHFSPFSRQVGIVLSLWPFPVSRLTTTQMDVIHYRFF